jgi:hypothetical protein
MGPDPYGQSNTLSIGKGICIVDNGFQNAPNLEILYGVTLSGDLAPMGLNLGAYSGLYVNFAGIETVGALYLIVEIDPSSGGAYVSEVELPTNADPSTVTLPYSSFVNGGVALTPAEASDISYIFIEAEDGNSSFGITSLKAYK